MIWTKQELAGSLNQRVDRGVIEGGSLILPLDISDEALEHFQSRWDEIGNFRPLDREKELVKLYQALIQEQ